MPIEVYKAIPVEAIRKANEERMQIMTNSSFNDCLLGKNGKGKYNVLPSKFGERPWLTGTGFAIPGKYLGFKSRIEKEFTNPDTNKKQILIFYVPKQDLGVINRMLLFDHQFKGNESTIRLINAINNKQILAAEDLHNADEIILKVVGRISRFLLNQRAGGNFEKYGEDYTKIWADETSAVGVLIRGSSGLGDYHVRTVVGARDNLNKCYSVVYNKI